MKELTFKDLRIGDVFCAKSDKSPEPIQFIKIGNVSDDTKIYEISECFPNALNLSNKHYVVFMPQFKARVIKERKDSKYRESIEESNAKAYDKLPEERKKYMAKYGVTRENYRVGKPLSYYKK